MTTCTVGRLGLEALSNESEASFQPASSASVPNQLFYSSWTSFALTSGESHLSLVTLFLGSPKSHMRVLDQSSLPLRPTSLSEKPPLEAETGDYLDWLCDL